MNEVFNSEYIPHINEEDILQNKLNNSKYKQQSMSIMSNIDSEGKKSKFDINGSFIRKNHNQSYNN